MFNVKGAWVSTIEDDYPYLEFFYKNSSQPFLEVGITADKKLNFKFYANSQEVDLTLDELRFILSSATKFHIKALKNEEDFLKWSKE